MIGYLDTSAFIPLLIAEPGSQAAGKFWNLADAVVSSRVMYIESAAALAQACRLGRITDDQHAAGKHHLEALWQQLDVVDLDDSFVRYAGELAADHALRGYDAAHCAAAALVNDSDVVAASGDKRLLAAWKTIGVATFDVNDPDDAR
ncbi:MAG: type II toxin-antitoxin system VapC family toxin [Nocardia sp.]|nr:type II toxin-antitoxin system VapC family toxin [Nocardia sp.]